jgi:hypothetical protein
LGWWRVRNELVGNRHFLGGAAECFPNELVPKGVFVDFIFCYRHSPEQAHKPFGARRLVKSGNKQPCEAHPLLLHLNTHTPTER